VEKLGFKIFRLFLSKIKIADINPKAIITNNNKISSKNDK